ncbi:protein lifeguard 1 [Lampetra fluviatilis]
MSKGDKLELLLEEYEPNTDTPPFPQVDHLSVSHHRSPPEFQPQRSGMSATSADEQRGPLFKQDCPPGEFLPYAGPREFGTRESAPPGTYVVGILYPKTPCNIGLLPPGVPQPAGKPERPPQGEEGEDLRGSGPTAPMGPPAYPWPTIQEVVECEDRPPDYEAAPEMLAVSSWEKTVRKAFIRKVFLVLTAQMLVTLMVVAVFTFVQPVMHFVQHYPLLYYASFMIYVVSAVALICCGDLRRTFPCNIITLGIITLAVSYMVGTIASRYTTRSVFTAAGITLAVCFVIVLFSMQTKYDFTCCVWLILPLVTCLFFSAMLAIVYRNEIMFVVWGSLGAMVFSLFLAVDVQLIIGNKQYKLSPEEYIYAALCLYLDVVKIFLYILMAIGGRK